MNIAYKDYLTAPRAVTLAECERMHQEILSSRFNMLSRYLKSIGKSNSWREELGYEEEDTVNRKRIGDFGCYLAFVHALNGR